MADPARNIYDDEDQEDFYEKSKKRQELEAVEGGGEGDSKPRGDLKEVDSDGSGYSPDVPTESEQSGLEEKSGTAKALYRGGRGSTKGKKRFSFKITKKRGAIFGGSGIGITLAVYIFSIFSGPLQFLAVGNAILPNFAALNITSNTRTGSLMRYLNFDRNHPERGRLGIVGNRVADSIESRLNADGIFINRSAGGTMDSIIVDGDIIDLSDYRNSQRRSAFKKALRSKGYSRTMTSIMSRPLFTRFGINFRFLGNLSRRASETYQEYKQRIKEQARDYINGDIVEVGALERQIDELEQERDRLIDADAPQEDIDAVEGLLEQARGDLGEFGELQEELRDIYDSTPGDQDAKLNQTRDALISRSAAGGLIATAIGIGVCFLQNIADQAIDLEYEQRYLPSIRLGMEAVSIADQIKSGVAVDSEELSVLSERLSTESSTWAEAENIKELQGEEGGTPAPSNIKVGDVEDDTLVQIGNVLGVGPLTPICDALQNVLVQWTLIGLEAYACIGTLGLGCLITVGGAEAAEEAFSRFVLSPYGDQYMKSLLGEEISEYTAGADYGNVVAQGTHFAANEAFREVGGLSLSPQEETALNNYTAEKNREYYASRSFFDRFFNPRNELSLVGSGIIQADNSLNLASLNPFGIVTSTFKSVGSATNNFASAQETNSYSQVPKVSFSVEELGRMESEDTLINPWENEEYLLDKYGSTQGIEDEFEGCISTAPAPGESVEPGYYLAESSCQGHEDFFRYRVYKFDHATLLSLGCYSGDQTSCTELGLDASVSVGNVVAGSGIVGDPYSDTTEVQCAQGTQDLGIHEGYVDGEAVDIRLCSLPNMPSTAGEATPGSPYYIEGANGNAIVNSRMSGAWFSLVNAAAADGVTLSAGSSFRTMEHQQALCDGNAACRSGDYSAVAPPGRSSHQAGVAIDIREIFLAPGVSVESGATCSSRTAYTDVPEWVWMAENASDFGLMQYAGEGWHWDALDIANRCDSSERPSGF